MIQEPKAQEPKFVENIIYVPLPFHGRFTHRKKNHVFQLSLRYLRSGEAVKNAYLRISAKENVCGSFHHDKSTHLCCSFTVDHARNAYLHRYAFLSRNAKTLLHTETNNTHICNRYAFFVLEGGFFRLEDYQQE